MTINAFHPDYVKTYMPEFLNGMRVEARQKEASKNLTRHVDKRRKDKPSHGTLFGISDKVVSIQPLDYIIHKRKGKK